VNTRNVLAAAAIVLLGSARAVPALAAGPSALEVLQKSQQAFYYAGDDMKVRLTMNLVTVDGNKRTRVLTTLRKNSSSQNQSYLIYFHEPADVQKTAFLILKYPERDDDRWIFIPAITMIRKIAASDEHSSFVGSDFTYEDISGRDLPVDDHTLLPDQKLDGVDCWVVQSTPKTPTMDFLKKISWIDKTNYLPRKEEYYDAQNQLARVFAAEKIEDVAVGQGAKKKVVPTIMVRSMTNVKSKHRTEVLYDRLEYDVGLTDDLFTQKALQSPPVKWIQP
jgi:outer membrane lipoprotein-sorting protein